ncbi:MAG: hypothetical protein A2033_03845 [Bacteroidetes bacterium GWA2_31_9]|nr:MAG: hypothetical protein A2033_03845 [Bacteroidetes bacterium GWA2_31_9]
MKEFKHSNSDLLIALSIVIIGFVLRLINFSEMSFSNDELSAVARLNYQTFSDLIEYGVKTDGHPAGVQIFLYYWTSIFGNSVFSIRLPFILAGTLSIFVSYLVAKKWFNSTVALFTASAFAFLEYPIFYSQLARPYSFGLLFSLLNLYYWSIIFIDKKYKISIFLLYAVTATFCAYTHYFSLLNVVVLGIISIFFLNKKNFKFFSIAIIFSIILYIPHVNIFLYQFSVGGVGGWLPKPDNDWIIDYLFYISNNSYLVIFCFVALILAVVLFFSNKKYFSKYQVISVLLFVITFLTGFFYSKYVNAVLQYSVLIFSFIFLIMFLFSFIKKELKVLKYILLPIFSIVLISSTVIEKKYYSTEHFGEFKKIAEKIDKWNNAFGNENVTNIINVNRDYYIKYYLNDSNTVSFVQTRNDGNSDIYDLLSILKNCKTDYISYSWSNKSNPPEVIELINVYFPFVADYSEHFNSEAYLFTKDSLMEKYKREKPFFSLNESFEFDSRFDSSLSFCSNKSYLIDSSAEYGSSFQYTMSTFVNKLNSLTISFKFLTNSIDFKDVKQVVSIETADGKNISWRCIELSNFNDGSSWNDFRMSYSIPENYTYNENDIIKIYIWNKGFKRLNIDCFELNCFTNLRPQNLD